MLTIDEVIERIKDREWHIIPDEVEAGYGIRRSYAIRCADGKCPLQVFTGFDIAYVDEAGKVLGHPLTEQVMNAADYRGKDLDDEEREIRRRMLKAFGLEEKS